MPDVTVTVDLTQEMFDELVDGQYAARFDTEAIILGVVLNAAVEQHPDLELGCRHLYQIEGHRCDT